MKRYKPEQILTLLRQIEVEIANGKTTPQAHKKPPVSAAPNTNSRGNPSTIAIHCRACHSARRRGREGRRLARRHRLVHRLRDDCRRIQSRC